MKRKRTTAPGFHQDLWVMFVLGAAMLAWNTWFTGWSREGQALAARVLAAYLLLGGGAAAAFCAATEDPLRRKRRKRRRRGTCRETGTAVY